MRYGLRYSAIALALLAGASSGAGAQGKGDLPIHIHRESTPPPRAQNSEIGARVRVHLQQMEAARASALFPKGPQLYVLNTKTMIPEHTRLISNLVDDCALGMDGRAGDAEHEAALEAVRRDVARLRELRSNDLNAFLPGHLSRVNRLLALHRGALGS
jgi:hypothetical protein